MCRNPVLKTTESPKRLGKQEWEGWGGGRGGGVPGCNLGKKKKKRGAKGGLVENGLDSPSIHLIHVESISA